MRYLKFRNISILLEVQEIYWLPLGEEGKKSKKVKSNRKKKTQ